MKDLFEEPSGLKEFAKEHDAATQKDLLASDVKINEKLRSEKSKRESLSRKETAKTIQEKAKSDDNNDNKRSSKTGDGKLTQDQMEQVSYIIRHAVLFAY